MAYILDTNVVIKLTNAEVEYKDVFNNSCITSITLKEIFKSLENNYERNKSTIKYILDNKIRPIKTDIEEIIYCAPFGLGNHKIPGIYDYETEVAYVLKYPDFESYKSRVLDARNIAHKAGINYDFDPKMSNFLMNLVSGQIHDLRNSYDLHSWESHLNYLIKNLSNKSVNRIKSELIKDLIRTSMKIKEIKPKSKVINNKIEEFQLSRKSDKLSLFLDCLSNYISAGKREHRNDCADINILAFVHEIDTLVTADRSLKNLVNSVQVGKAISYDEYLEI